MRVYQSFPLIIFFKINITFYEKNIMLLIYINDHWNI